jgi:hypothetical protein
VVVRPAIKARPAKAVDAAADAKKGAK